MKEYEDKTTTPAFAEFTEAGRAPLVSADGQIGACAGAASAVEAASRAGTTKPSKPAKQLAPGRLYRRENIAAFLMILPSVLSFSVFILAPMVFAIILSVTQFEPLTATFQFVGFDNFAKLFNPKDWQYGQEFYRCMINTVFYLIEVPIVIALGLMAAALISGSKIRYNKIFRILLYLPTVCSVVAASIIWQQIFLDDPARINRGFLNYLFGTNIKWLSDQGWVLAAIIIKNSICGMGRSMILFYASISTIPPEYYEAAELDGANGWQKFWHITFAMVTPTLFYQLIMRVSGTLQSYADSAIFASGDPDARTAVYFIWNFGINQHNYNIASAAALILGVIIMIVTVIQFRRSSKWVVQL